MRASVLDNSETYTRLDPSVMRDRLRGLGGQCRDAWNAVHNLQLPKSYGKTRVVVLAGMGGSAIGGDLLADLASAKGVRLPIFTWRDYGLPNWVDGQTLIVVSSYSGETEEALSAFHTAMQRSAPVVALTSGGALQRLAEANGVPVVCIPPVGEPRVALGWAFVAPLALLVSLDLFPDMEAEAREAATLLEALARSWSPETPEAENLAKNLASRANGHLPVVYGAGLLSGAARRWKTDINENAKSWASAETFPELCHNTITAYAHPEDLSRNSMVILLRSSLLPPRIQLRYQVTAELLEHSVVPHTFVDAQGSTPLSHILTTAHLGSWVSYYLAILYGMDPSPIPATDYMKRKLKEAGSP